MFRKKEAAGTVDRRGVVDDAPKVWIRMSVSMGWTPIHWRQSNHNHWCIEVFDGVEAWVVRHNTHSHPENVFEDGVAWVVRNNKYNPEKHHPQDSHQYVGEVALAAAVRNFR